MTTKTLPELLTDLHNQKAVVDGIYANRPTIKKADGSLAQVIDLPAILGTLESTNQLVNTSLNELQEALDSAATLRPVSSKPLSASAPGSPGQYFVETGSLYLCVATNSWIRIATQSTWT